MRAFLMLVVAASCGGGLPAPVDEALTTATPLRSYADPKHIRIGTTVSPDGFSNEELYKQILAHQFNIVVSEHMGMDVLQLQKGNWDFTKTDALLEYTAANQLDVWGPSLIYALDNPKWLDDGSWSPSDMDGIIHDHLQHVLDHVRGRIPWFNVVNEAFNDDGSYATNIYTDTYGSNLGHYVEVALQDARAIDPNVKLFINEHDAETPNDKFNAMYAMVSDFKTRGIPIDGIGYQMHIKVNALDHDPAYFDKVAQTMKAYADLGIEVAITELDVRIETPASDADLAKQATLYAGAFDVCHAQPACTMFMMWGFSDRYSWIPKFFSGQGEALILDDRFAFKPAYDALLARLAAP